MNKDELLEVIKAEAMESIIRDALFVRVKGAYDRFHRVYRNCPYKEDYEICGNREYIYRMYTVPLTEEEVALYLLCEEYESHRFPIAPDGVSTLFKEDRGQR
jgi:hypothetical protein